MIPVPDFDKGWPRVKCWWCKRIRVRNFRKSHIYSMQRYCLIS